MQGVSRLSQEEASASVPGNAQEQACNDQLDPCSQMSIDTAARIRTVPLQKDHATEIQSSLQTQVHRKHASQQMHHLHRCLLTLLGWKAVAQRSQLTCKQMLVEIIIVYMPMNAQLSVALAAWTY